MAGKRRDPIPPEIIEYARREAGRQIARRDRREQANRALVAVRATIAAIRDLYSSKVERPERLATELALEEMRLARFVDVPPTLPEAKIGEGEHDVMVRVLADPSPPLDCNYPPTLGTKPLATQRQIAEWIAGFTAGDLDDMPGAKQERAEKSLEAGRGKAKREAGAAREQGEALQNELDLRRQIREAFDDISDDN